MATKSLANQISSFASVPETHIRQMYRRLGLLNGLLIGLALTLGAWGQDAVRAIGLPLPLAN